MSAVQEPYWLVERPSKIYFGEGSIWIQNPRQHILDSIPQTYVPRHSSKMKFLDSIPRQHSQTPFLDVVPRQESQTMVIDNSRRQWQYIELIGDVGSRQCMQSYVLRIHRMDIERWTEYVRVIQIRSVHLWQSCEGSMVEL